MVERLVNARENIRYCWKTAISTVVFILFDVHDIQALNEYAVPTPFQRLKFHSFILLDMIKFLNYSTAFAWISIVIPIY